ncbi:hypothetical protein PV08_10242 [Exophiala spinifera]|uniref:Alpha/beta hydrolase fold-3 domain-containing protein n=1 Tax=Exophiala spinifera TaxID=91928 RepID=A0A0D2AW38_9EURO|nr:uncharacterized protein PV08_10242 [Exophiala spinifera]KIW10943.1 hypothetical protein PV08_10242 [Exophiala spinifera]
MPSTVGDKVLLVPGLSYVFARSILALLGSPFRGSKGAPTVTEHVLQTAFRVMFTHFTTGQLQILLPSFEAVYIKFCTQKKLTPKIVDIPNTTTRGFWLGDPDSATYVMVYFHGGGFVMPGLAQHIDLLSRFVQWSGGKLAVFCNAYTLAPEGVYPLQLAESVEALRYVLSLPNRTPDTTMIGGDSAGGNLVCAVLSHISAHPHPRSDVVKPFDLAGKLQGALMIAPWASSDASKFKSMTEFAKRDIVNPGCANYWIDAYKGRGKNIKDDEYIVAEQAPPSWWSGVKVSSVLMTAGDQEALRDAIVSLANKIKQGVGSDVVKLVVGKNEIHDAPLTPLAENELEKRGDQSQEGAIRLWLKERLQ